MLGELKQEENRTCSRTLLFGGEAVPDKIWIRIFSQTLDFSSDSETSHLVTDEEGRIHPFLHFLDQGAAQVWWILAVDGRNGETIGWLPEVANPEEQTVFPDLWRYTKVRLAFGKVKRF